MNTMKLSQEEIGAKIKDALEQVDVKNTDTLKKIFNLIDLTSLNTADYDEKINQMVEKVNKFPALFPEMPNVAAICIYPPFVETVKENLHAANVSIAVVSAGFPSSQTYLSVKLAESEIAANKGADELDIVLSLGRFISGDIAYCMNEISIIKQAIGEKHLKVILESGLMESPEQVYQAGMLALKAGADFIKTSTGKDKKSADPVSVYAMCLAIKDYYEETGKKSGIKPAGGISTPEDAIVYFAIIKAVLGDEWLNNELFRIGASRLSNNLLSTIYNKEVKYF
ncbi:MAG: deoxyribose-phosphate aldolase [Bacteroidales bacterium]|nr:deoxyribose-phosphate aldolase [Bacteroidales bacterium]